MNGIDLIPETILACCILHNICLDGVDDDIENYILDGGAIDNEINIIYIYIVKNYLTF